jgi:FdhD protein
VSSESVQAIEIVRVDGQSREQTLDRVAVERPLEVRVDGEPFSVVMRTPGDDEHLAVGFLVSEGVLVVPGDLDRIVTDVDVVDVRRSAGAAVETASVAAARRQVAMNSSCGMCGRVSLEQVERDGARLEMTWTVDPAVVASLPGRLAANQPAFDETGGLHAAALATPAGDIECSAEDVGRHNAVDKLIGRMWMAGRAPLGGTILVVSGRLSYEIVQKAWIGGIPMIVAVSAPSSMAVDLAVRAGMTIAGFTRNGRFNVYAGHARLAVASVRIS